MELLKITKCKKLQNAKKKPYVLVLCVLYLRTDFITDNNRIDYKINKIHLLQNKNNKTFTFYDWYKTI